MAAVAFRLDMLTRQGIFGVLVVVESRRLPAAFVVATLALVAQPSLVPLFVVVLAMTARAFQGEFLLIQSALVACRAFCLFVLALQAEISLLMIKGRLVPRLGRMAFPAFLAEAAFVAVLVVGLAVA